MTGNAPNCDNMSGDELYAYLRTQFTDLAGAKEWYRRWYSADQELNPYMSPRAMAFHVSQVLEGKPYDDKWARKEGWFTSYLRTKYGSEIFMG